MKTKTASKTAQSHKASVIKKSETQQLLEVNFPEAVKLQEAREVRINTAWADVFSKITIN
jgi:hypothetical protein